MLSQLRGRRTVLVLLAIAQLMVILDISAVNVALPDLTRDLGITRGSYEWTITSYSLLFGSLMLLGGRAADLLGRRRVFLTGQAIFLAGSLGAAFAPSASLLYSMRAVQGIGAALLSPAALSIITATFTEARERAVALGIWGGVAGGGGAVGVLLGGILTSTISWRAIFFVNLPIGVLLCIGVLRVVAADRARPRWSGLDLHGALLATAGIFGLLYALAGAADAGWLSGQTLGFGLAGLALLAFFAALERRSVTPLLRIDRLADRIVASGWTLLFVSSVVLFGVFLLTSLLLQEVLGGSPLMTGVEFVPFAAAAAVGSQIGSSLVRRFGVRAPALLGFVLAGAGVLLLSRAGVDSIYASGVLPGMVAVGGGLGMVMVTSNVAVLSRARADEEGMLSGFNNTGHEVGGALGIAALTTVIARSVAGAGATAGPAALASGISEAFVVAAVIAAAGLMLTIVILPAASAVAGGQRPAPLAAGVHGKVERFHWLRIDAGRRRVVTACTTPRDRFLVELLLATGVRVSEACALRVDDLALDAQERREPRHWRRSLAQKASALTRKQVHASPW